MNEGKPLNYSWYDYTVESGVWYKYGAQRKNEKGDRGILILANPVMIILDDIFLTRSKMQFKVKFDPSISSFKYNYLEAKTDTLGSKYPFFKRNGNVKYRQFSIQGLITAWCDEQGVFLNKNNIYGDFVDDYNKYNQENNITEYRDYVYEKEFRDKIIDFLYANDVKLFRSPTEGNILIRLMNISFTPNQTLGRMLYTFSAEAYEIDECNLDNFQKYGIQSLIDRNSTEEAIPPDDEKISYVYDKIGQINGEFSGTEEDLLNQLKNKYESTSKDFSTVVDKIKWLRIEFNSDPYLIEDIDGVPKKAVLTKTHSFNEDISEGYIININDQSIIISPRKYIEFADDDTEITSVYFPYPTEVTFDYTVQLEDTENSSTIYSKVYLYTKVGQLHDIYQPQDNVFKKIYGSYLADYNKTHQELISIDKLTVETEPRTVIYIKDSFDNSYFKHEIGETGVLEFYDDEAVVTGFYFSGIHLYPAENGIVVEGKYIETGVSVNSESGIKNPIENGVYTINNQRTIYYKSQFYKFNEDDEVECPIETTVDYVYELMKGSY